MRTYLDHNASAPLLPDARDAMLAAMDIVGNPSSVHGHGREARSKIEQARSILASAFEVSDSQVIFTSGASEAGTLALSPTVRMGSELVAVSKLYVSAIEHPCVLKGGRFTEKDICHVPVLESGCVNLDALETLLKSHDHTAGMPMVAVMAANNETGIVQPISELGALVDAHNGLLVVDAVQSFTRIPMDYAAIGAHFVIVSSHKIGGPKGAGALITMQNAMQPMPMMSGGGQENHLRAGTENVAAIAGFGAAVDVLKQKHDNNTQVKELRDALEDGLTRISRHSSNSCPLPVFFGAQVERLPNTSCFAVEGMSAETLLIALDLEGISVSSGSACSSGKVGISHVLTAMGVKDELARAALRVSLGFETEKAHVTHFLDVWNKIVERRAA